MAEGKKSFILYADLIKNIDHLTNEEKGILFQHLLEYVNDMNPVLEDRVLLSAWKFIQSQLKRDLERFEEKINKKSEAGSLGNLKKYNIDLYNDVKNNVLTLNKALELAKTRKAAQLPQSDTKTAVNDNDNVNDNVITTIYDKFVDEVKKGFWSENINILYMNLGLREGSLTPLLKQWYETVVLFEKRKHKNTQEFLNNFRNWLNVQESNNKLNQYKK